MVSIKKNRKFNLSSGKVGVIAELIVAVNLTKKGWEVYRAISQASGSDLVAIKDNVIKTFEVRTGKYKSKNNITRIFKEYEKAINPNPIILSNLSYPKNNMKSDYFAVVTFSDGKTHYEPKLT